MRAFWKVNGPVVTKIIKILKSSSSLGVAGFVAEFVLAQKTGPLVFWRLLERRSKAEAVESSITIVTKQ